MENKNLISPNKKLEITFGEMSEQAMGGAYFCSIYLKNEHEEAFLLHERSVGNALWQGNSKIYFPIWVRNSEGYLKQKIAFFDVKRSKIGIFDRFFEVIELKSIKGDLIEVIDSPNWHPKNIVFDVKNEAVSETFSWTKMDAEIVAIKSRMNLTKGGNWYAFPEGRDPIKGYRFIFTDVEHIDDVHNQNQDKLIFYSGETEADIDFIAHARQDIPILLKEIELLKTDKYGADFLILDTALHTMKARYEATSIAPWLSFIEGRDLEAGSSFIMTGIEKGDYIWDEKRGEDIEFSGTPSDLEFIAHARQDIPMLIAEIERLKLMMNDKG